MRILLSGYYGFGNAGDEAILAGTLAGLRRRLPSCEVTVLSAQPKATSAATGARAAQRWHWPTLWRELGRTDLLVQGGGGLLQDSTSALSPLYYLGVLLAAQLRRRQFAIHAQGLGPLRGRFTGWLTGRLFRRAAAITVRDPASAELLLALGVRREITVTADAAALLEPAPPEEAARFLPPPNGRPRVGFALREAPGAERLFEGALRAGERLRDRHGVECVVMALHAMDDVAPALRAAARLGGAVVGADATPTPREWLSLVGSLDAVVSMRLHAAIFAAATGVPFVSLSYDPKVAAFAESVGAPSLTPEADPEEIVKVVEEAWQARQTGAAARAAAAVGLRAAAERNLDVLVALARQ